MSKRRGVLSLWQQWLLIAVLVMVPVLTVIIYATWSFYHQMQVQQQIVGTTDYVNSLQASINDQLRELERNVRQYQLFQDDRFLDPYRQRLSNLRAIRKDLVHLSRPDFSSFQVPSETVARWQQSLNSALDLMDEFLVSLEEKELPALDEQDFSQLLAEMGQFRAGFDRLIASYTRYLSQESEDELQSILWRLSIMGFVTLPMTFVLVALGLIQMVRPLRKLSSTVVDLGNGRWESPIDISGPRDFQRLGERLEWMRVHLLEADRQKQAFLRHISHELKTPLSAILEAGSLLEDEVPGPVTPGQREVLGILVQNSQNLQELIQQLLNYNVITHNFEPQKSSVNLAELCRRIARRLDQKSYRHQVVWDFEGAPDTLSTDPQLVEMILSNLFSNAFHFSPTGAMVRVRWGQEKKHVWLTVEDQGPGIDERDQGRVFEPFFQGSARREGSVQGSGVGLAIVKESVTNLGGTIRIESNPGKGTRFALSLPRDWKREL